MTWTYNACHGNFGSAANRGCGGDGLGGNGGKGDGFHPSLTTSLVAVPPRGDSKMLRCGCHGILNWIIGPLLQLCRQGKEKSEGILPKTAVISYSTV